MSVTPYEPHLPEPQPNSLMQWAIEAGEVHKIAKALSTTSFVPAALQGRPDEIAAQILYGRDVNLPPMIALAQINIIDRKPSLSALAMRGLAQNSGVKFRLDDSSEVRCKMSALAPGDGSWTTVTWTIDRAKKLGLTSKQNWQKQPQAMLIARATSELCRLVAAPLFLGMAYSSEELRDGADDLSVLADQPVTPPPAQEKPRTLKRETPVKATATVIRVRQEEPAEPPPAEPADSGYTTTDDSVKRPQGTTVERPDMVSAPVRAALMAAFRAANIGDRVTRLSYVSDLLKREVHSVNQITDAEGRAILDQLHIDYPQTAPQRDWGDVEVQQVPS